MGTYIPPVAMAPPTYGPGKGPSKFGNFMQGGGADLVGGLAGGLISGLAGRGRSKQLQGYQTAGFQGAQGAMGSLSNLGGQFQGYGGRATEAGLSNLGESSDFYRKLLQGDQATLDKMTGLGMSDLAQSLAQGRKFAARTGTRSGATAYGVSQAPAQLAQERARQRVGAFQTGAQGLGALGGTLGQLGGTYGQIGTQAFGQSGNIGLGLGREATEALKQQNEGTGWFGKMLGGGIGLGLKALTGGIL